MYLTFRDSRVSRPLTSFMNLTKFMSSLHFPRARLPTTSAFSAWECTDFAVEHPVCPPQQCENICPFQRCHTYIQSTPSHDWSSLFLYRHASCACIHTCHCFKILFPAIDPYASSLVVLQSLMKYSTHLRMCLQNVCPQALNRHMARTSTVQII